MNMPVFSMKSLLSWMKWMSFYRCMFPRGRKMKGKKEKRPFLPKMKATGAA